jgi:arginase
VTVIAVPFHLDEHLPDLELPLTADRTIAPDLPPGAPWGRMAVLYEEVADVVATTPREVVQSPETTGTRPARASVATTSATSS